MKKTKQRCWECRRAATTPTQESVRSVLCLRHYVMLSWPYLMLAVQRREVGLPGSTGEVALMSACSMAPPDAPPPLPEVDEDDEKTCSLCSPARGTGRSTGLCWWHQVLILSRLFVFLARTGQKRMSWRRRR